MAEPPPPWTVFPETQPHDPPTQGAVEAYVDLEWLPHWLTLDTAQRQDYLDRWQASTAWREVIRDRYDPTDLDIEQDARDSAAWREAARPHGRSRLRRWLGMA